MNKQRELEEEIQHLKQANSAFKVSRDTIRRAMRPGNLMQQRHSYLSEHTKQDIRAQKSENIIKRDFTARP